MTPVVVLSCLDIDGPGLSATALRMRAKRRMLEVGDLTDLRDRLLSADPVLRPSLLLEALAGDGASVAETDGSTLRCAFEDERGCTSLTFDLSRLGEGRHDDLAVAVDILSSSSEDQHEGRPPAQADESLALSRALEDQVLDIAKWVESVFDEPDGARDPGSDHRVGDPATMARRLIRGAVALLTVLAVEARRMQRIEVATRLHLPRSWTGAVELLSRSCRSRSSGSVVVPAAIDLLDETDLEWLERFVLQEDCYERLLQSILSAGGIQLDLGNLAVTEIGMLHEALAGYSVDVEPDGRLRLSRSDRSGRDEGGVFYTPPALVDEVLEQALMPVIRQQLDVDGDCTAILRLTVCDPACGAGNFLIAAARRLALQAARSTPGSDERSVMAAVVSGCIFGADRDEFAVRLATVALRILCDPTGTATPRLDGNLVVGDSLIGCWRDDLEPDMRVESATAQISLFEEVASPPTNRQSYDMGSADAWCSSWFLSDDVDSRQFLHWPLAFPAQVRPGEDALFDVVIGNPPYVRGREHAKSDPAGRRFISAKFSACHGSQWNLFVPFVVLAARLARRRSCMLVQSSVLGSQYAGALHEHLLTSGSVEACLDFSDVPSLFPSAAVQVAALVAVPEQLVSTRFVRYATGLNRAVEVRVSRAQLEALPSGYWTLPTSKLPAVERDLLTNSVLRLGDVANIRDGMEQSEAYAVIPLVHESSGASSELRLIPTGMIDPFRLRWGERPVRYLGHSFAKPVVDEATLRSAGFGKMADQGAAEKIAIAGLSSRLEACVDEGRSLVSKSAFEIRLLDPELCPYAVCVVLNSSLMNRIYDAAFGALGFGAGSRNYRPPTLAALPLPNRDLLRRHASREGATATRLSELGRRLHAAALAGALPQTALDEVELEVHRAFGLEVAMPVPSLGAAMSASDHILPF